MKTKQKKQNFKFTPGIDLYKSTSTCELKYIY